jgi:hypothetical protein
MTQSGEVAARVALSRERRRANALKVSHPHRAKSPKPFPALKTQSQTIPFTRKRANVRILWSTFRQVELRQVLLGLTSEC